MDETKTVKLAEDSFLHFTYLNRAKEILASGKLLANPPYDKFGISGVQAVSINHGMFLPGVQLTHLQKDDNEDKIVAILFKTNTIPKIGFIEEIIWSGDVNLIDPQIVDMEAAIGMIRDLDDETVDDDIIIMYESLLVKLL